MRIQMIYTQRTHSQQIQHGHRVQQAASLETYTSHRAAGHSADGLLKRVIEFMQQLVHVLHTSLLQCVQDQLIIKVYQIIGEEHIVARVEEVVASISQYLSRKGKGLLWNG